MESPRNFWVTIGPRDDTTWLPKSGSQSRRVTNIRVDLSPFDDLRREILPSLAPHHGYSKNAKVVAYAILPAQPPWIPEPAKFECTSNKTFKDNIALLPCIPPNVPSIGGSLTVAFWFIPVISAPSPSKRRRLNANLNNARASVVIHNDNDENVNAINIQRPNVQGAQGDDDDGRSDQELAVSNVRAASIPPIGVAAQNLPDPAVQRAASVPPIGVAVQNLLLPAVQRSAASQPAALNVAAQRKRHIEELKAAIASFDPHFENGNGNSEAVVEKILKLLYIRDVYKLVAETFVLKHAFGVEQYVF